MDLIPLLSITLVSFCYFQTVDRRMH